MQKKMTRRPNLRDDIKGACNAMRMYVPNLDYLGCPDFRIS